VAVSETAPFYFTRRSPGRHNKESYCIRPNSRSRAGQTWCERVCPLAGLLCLVPAILGSAAQLL
jgi:hypothetical protein